jgi:hypothetical protein
VGTITDGTSSPAMPALVLAAPQSTTSVCIFIGSVFILCISPFYK